MSETIHVACPGCWAANRLPTERLAQAPNCGRCHAPLFDGHPVPLTDGSFADFVKRTDLPLVLDCWAPWCPPCRAFAPVFEQAAAQLEPQVRLAKLDTEANPATAAQLRIRSIPTLIALRGGVEVARTSGAMPLPQFVGWVRQVLR